MEDDRILHDFRDLLLDFPGWDRERRRRRLAEQALGKGHRVMAEITWSGSAKDLAWELPSACEDFPESTRGGRSPLCALLAVMGEDLGPAHPLAQRLAALQSRLGCVAPSKVDWHADPYPGMLALDHTQALIFFGRRAETSALLAKLDSPQGRRLLLVTGASGSGKSSLVRAGLWATLQDAEATPIPGSADWVITVMKPSKPDADPYQALAWSLAATPIPGLGEPDGEADSLRSSPDAFASLLDRVLAGRPRHAEWLLIVDQFEELFTSVAPHLAGGFLDRILLPALEQPRFRVVATLRSDFLDRWIAHPGLREEYNDEAPFGVGAPGPAAMAAMIEGPVRRLTLARPVSLDDRLTEELVKEASGRDGGLALLAFALKDLYDQCKGKGSLELADYRDEDRLGGLDGVIAKRAQEAVARAGVDTAALLPRVFSRLLTVQTDGAATRLREDLAHWRDDPQALRLVEALSAPDTRLLVLSAKRGERAETDPPGSAAGGYGREVEVAHEALFHAWPALDGWIAKRREALIRRPQVERDAERWQAEGRPDHRIYKPDIAIEIRDLLEGAELWRDMARDSRVAHFLVRDDPGELLALARRAFAAGEGDGMAAMRADLLHMLTAEGRSPQTLRALVEGIGERDADLADWLRAGIDIAALLGGEDAPRWHRHRLGLGDLLAALGDRRPGVGLREDGLRKDGLPDICWQQVPAGPFLWQDGEERTTGAYRIARHPVTGIQYGAFTQAPNYTDPRWWLEWGSAPDPARPQWSQDNRPRVEVAWFEALAYCRWLTAGFREQGLIGGAEEIRLPDEYEWEKAARGTDGRSFPWGEGYESGDANIDETYDGTGPLFLRETCAVGLYPRNLSPYGLADCSGNVWEWCLNKYDDPDDIDTGGEAMRALRGGSWSLNQTFARVCARSRLNFGDRYLVMGFRLLWSGPIGR